MLVLAPTAAVLHEHTGDRRYVGFSEEESMKLRWDAGAETVQQIMHAPRYAALGYGLCTHSSNGDETATLTLGNRQCRCVKRTQWGIRKQFLHVGVATFACQADSSDVDEPLLHFPYEQKVTAAFFRGDAPQVSERAARATCVVRGRSGDLRCVCKCRRGHRYGWGCSFAFGIHVPGHALSCSATAATSSYRDVYVPV